MCGTPMAACPRPFSYDNACATGSYRALCFPKELTSDQTKSAETVAIENNFSEAKAVARGLVLGNPSPKLSPLTSWNAAAFMDTLNDREQMQEWIDGEPGTMESSSPRNFSGTSGKLVSSTRIRLSRPNPAQAPQDPPLCRCPTNQGRVDYARSHARHLLAGCGKLLMESIPRSAAEPYGGLLTHPRVTASCGEKYQRAGAVPPTWNTRNLRVGG